MTGWKKTKQKDTSSRSLMIKRVDIFAREVKCERRRSEDSRPACCLGQVSSEHSWPQQMAWNVNCLNWAGCVFFSYWKKRSPAGASVSTFPRLIRRSQCAKQEDPELHGQTIIPLMLMKFAVCELKNSSYLKAKGLKTFKIINWSL